MPCVSSDTKKSKRNKTLYKEETERIIEFLRTCSYVGFTNENIKIKLKLKPTQLHIQRHFTHLYKRILILVQFEKKYGKE